jgi:hypothetical protein
MARDSRQRSTRKDQPLNAGQRPVQLRESRRFLTSQGNDQATRQARALQQAFGVGADLTTEILNQRNEKGRSTAAFESAAGMSRDAETTNKGYAEMWDEIEAKNDLALFAKELPEVLRGADWENLGEDEAQAVIDGYYSAQLKGINPQSVYGQQVSEGIFAQNAQLLDTHRNFQLERVRQEQRVMIYNEAKNGLEIDGVVDYEKIGKRTGLAFDGAEKVTTYWEMIFDLAIDAGDETIISNAPERFPSGDPTGISDPNMAEDINTAISKARAVREGREAGVAAAAKAQREELRKNGRAHLTVQLLSGIDPTADTVDLLRNGIIQAEDATAAVSAWRTSRDDAAQHGFDAPRVNQLQTQIALNPSHPMVSPLNLQQEWAKGAFGPPHSPEAKTAYRQMLADLEGSQDRKQRLAADPRKKTWVNRFDESFPVPSNQFGFPAPGPLTELRAEYSAMFELAILEAGPADYANVYTQYAEMYKKAEGLTNAQVQSRTPQAVFRNVLNGAFTPEQGAAHMRQTGMTVEQLISAKAGGELKAEPGTPEFEQYRLLLEQFAN